MLDNILKDARDKVSISYKVFIEDLSSVRTGRASPSLLDGIVVDAHGSKIKLNQVSNVSAVSNLMLSVNIWDKSLVASVKNAISASNLGINPVVEGQVIRLPIPDLTEERRKELIKVIRGYAERARVTSRNVRREIIAKIRSLEKTKEISEDDMHSGIKKIEADISSSEKKIDEAVAKKEKELMKL